MRRILNNIRNHRNWWAYYLGKLIGSLKSGFTFQGRNGLAIEVPRRMLHTYKEIYFDETYLSGFPTSALSNKITTVVDIGANVGYFSLFMAGRYPEATVLACEPMPNNLNLLSSYQQSLPSNSFHIVPKAVSGQNGTIELFFDQTDDFTTSASIGNLWGEEDKQTVESITLTSLLKENRIAQVDFLKLDCEGAEYEILLETPIETLQSIRLISMEYHDDPAGKSNPEELIALLGKAGFSLNRKGTKVWGWR